jgi:membrane protease YdiL (CAAX protease family)
MPAVFVLGSLLLLAGLAWVTYQSGRLLRAIPVRENLLLAPTENAVKVALIAICAGLAAISGLPPAQFGWAFPQPGAELASGILFGLVAQGLANVITLWAVRRYGKGVYSPVVMKNIYPRSRREWALSVPAMFIAVALEEALFRSLLLGGLSAFAPAPLLVVALAAVFGLMHSPQGALGMILAATVGAGLSGLFLWSGSLLPPLLAHYLINLLQLLRAREERQWLEEY